jgi:predicted nucleotide-binding protein
MAGMERFTQRARRVLSLAHQEAQRSHNSVIGTEHLLIGLMKEEGGVANRVLRELGLTSDRIREAVSSITSASPNFDPNRVELGAETQQALEFAVEEARRLGHHYIGTEHILLGLVRIDGIVLEVFQKLGVTVEHIRRQTRRILNEPAPSSSTKSISSRKSNQVLLVHGHDDETKSTIAKYVEDLGLNVVILNEQASRGLTFNEKFDSTIDETAFVVVILTADDLTAPSSDPKNTKFHAGQNVIYELGFFHGKLGRNRVCALFKSDPQSELELPAHFLGVVYIPLDNAGAWKPRLVKEMQEAGLNISLENIV